MPLCSGSYKDTVANTGCTGGGCPQHSETQVVGAVSPQDRKCSWCGRSELMHAIARHECRLKEGNRLSGCVWFVWSLGCSIPGYYAVFDESTLQCNEVEVGYFSRGGFNAERIKCPPFTSTNPENGLATDLTHCLCEPGYSPARAENLRDPNSPASSLKRWILLNPAYTGLDDSQVCMLCGRRFYKGTVSADACTECPQNSFSSSDGPTSKSSCNMCVAGYYSTENEDMPCGECQSGHFCVGSEPAVKALEDFAGSKIACSQYTKTMQPNSKNSHPFSCM